MKRKFHVPFWRAAALVRESLTLIKVKSVTVRKRTSGWFVSIRIEDTSIPAFPVKSNEEVNTIIGLDMGLGKLVYCSDGSVVNNPRFATNRKTRRLLSIRSRRVSRKKKRKNNRTKAQTILSALQHKTATRRVAHQWQTAKKIVNKADAIAVEDLNIRGMMKRCKPKWDEKTGRFLKNGQSAKRGLNRSIADASWSELISRIEYVAAKSGKVVFRVNPRCSSQECSVCHHIDPENRDGEKFLCTNCGHVDDANLQAARTIKSRAIEANQLVIKTLRKKVRRDSPEPKQLSLFETPTPELTGDKRRQPHARQSKRGVPGNLGEQLDLFNQDNKCDSFLAKFIS